MILYAETNFVLELAFEQEGHKNCRAILELAKEAKEGSGLKLTLPAFCVGEAYERQIRRQRHREELQHRLVDEMGELSRSPSYAGRVEEARRVTALLAESGEEELQRLELVLGELYDNATLLPLDEAVAREAHRQQSYRGLSPQDALVYASILGHLRQAGTETSPEEHSCFVTRDNHFTDEDIRTDLEELGCKILFKFDDALGYLRSHLS